MQPADRIVRIVVVQPIGPRRPGDAVDALSRLAHAAEIEIVRDAERCARWCDARAVDLVVLDRDAGGEGERVLEALAGGGPPVVAVVAGGDERAALALRRRGALGVPDGPELPAALAAAAREALRARSARASGVSGSSGDAEEKPLGAMACDEHVIQHMNSALLVVDARGRISSANPPAEAILGAPEAALGGRPFWDWLRGGHDAGAFLRRTLEDGARFRAAETALVRPDGTVVPVGMSCSPLCDADGRPIGAVAIFQDLTDAVQLRSQALQSEKLASIGQLAAGVAHEINNPMGFIHANLFQMAEYAADLRRVLARVQEVLASAGKGDAEATLAAAARLEETATEVDVAFVLADLEKAIRESQEGSERIRHIVQDLREFSHGGSDELVLSDVNQCLESTATIVWPMMKHLVTLERDYGELPAIPCYPMQLKQVFMNLLVNAYQAIEERVGESGELGRVRLSTRAVAGSVQVEVSDTGVGIPADDLDRIFDPFFTTKKVGAGTGLGLSTSFHIVERHGGRLSVESRVGEGALFRIFLPATPADA